MTMLFVVAITMASELSNSLQHSLNRVTGHHWISKGLLSLGVFLATTIISHPILSRRHNRDLTAWGIAITATALLGAVVLLLFLHCGISGVKWIKHSTSHSLSYLSPALAHGSIARITDPVELATPHTDNSMHR